MHWISPLERAGFNILAASRAPSAPPAPIIVWSSSINIIILFAFFISITIFFILSSNSPLYFVPATTEDKSKVKTLFLRRISGTSVATIFSANPSTIAVLPTPGSPKSIGLFFFLLDKIWTTRITSFSLPITLSNAFSLASFVKSLANWSKVGVFTFLTTSSWWACSFEFVAATPTTPITFIISCFKAFASSAEKAINLWTLGEDGICPNNFVFEEDLAIEVSNSILSLSKSTFKFLKDFMAIDSGSRSKPNKTCSGVTWSWFNLFASSWE